jgi:hypothetical protein
MLPKCLASPDVLVPNEVVLCGFRSLSNCDVSESFGICTCAYSVTSVSWDCLE